MKMVLLTGVLFLTALVLLPAACGPATAPSDSAPATTPAADNDVSATTSAIGVHPSTPESTTAPVVTTTAARSTAPASDVQPGPPPAPAVTITVLYDNTTACAGAQSGWGFSCLVQGLSEAVLFDTGADGDLLLANMDLLQVTPREIDVVVLSHDHRDHTGGLAAVIAANPDLTVYYPATFSHRTIAPALIAGAGLVPVEAAVSPAPGLTVTSPLGSPAESGLLVDTGKERVLLVGCAHPGVVEMTAAASVIAGGPVTAVMGGFHLGSASAEQVEQVIQGLQELGVERCGPAHCTGEAAIARISAAFGEGTLPMGAGSILTF